MDFSQKRHDIFRSDAIKWPELPSCDSEKQRLARAATAAEARIVRAPSTRCGEILNRKRRLKVASIFWKIT